MSYQDHIQTPEKPMRLFQLFGDSPIKSSLHLPSTSRNTHPFERSSNSP